MDNRTSQPRSNPQSNGHRPIGSDATRSVVELPIAIGGANGSETLPDPASHPIPDTTPNPAPTNATPTRQQLRDFARPVMLQPSSFWPRAILGALMGVATCTIAWAAIAQIEEAIPAQGKLEPQGAVKDVQVAVNGGVVKTVHVKDGQRVNQGDLLLSLDIVTPQARLASLQQIRAALVQETQFYQAQMQEIPTHERAIGAISPQLFSLTKSRAELVAENQLFRAQLAGASAGLSAGQLERWQSQQAESNTRTTAANLAVAQLQQQLAQVGVKLATVRKTLASNQGILNNLKPLAESGALSQVQYIRHQQTVDGNQAEIDHLLHEQSRLQSAIAEAQTQVENIRVVGHNTILDRLANNSQKIAELDGQLTKAIVENAKKLAELDSQISQTQQILQYSEVRAPAAGIVFDMKAGTPGYVINTVEPVLKLVPEENLIAKVSITNRDIGFVKTGMPVDVRIDSFPFSEFGDIKGTLVAIGSDALPPTQIQPHYTFPVKIQLNHQLLSVKGQPVKLQSGMSLSANIKIRQRTVMSIFTEQFTQGVESLKFAR
jgi:hemolysin D